MQRNEAGGNSSALDRAKAAWGAQSALIQGHKAEVMERNNYIRTGITNRHFRAFRQFCLEEDQCGIGKSGTGADLVEAIGPVKISGRKSKFLSDIARNFRAANSIMLESFDHTARRNLPSAFMP